MHLNTNQFLYLKKNKTMENTLNNSLSFINKWCESNEQTYSDEQKRELSKLLYYYGKEIDNEYTSADNYVIKNDDITQINIESNLITNEISQIQNALVKIAQATTIINKYTKK